MNEASPSGKLGRSGGDDVRAGGQPRSASAAARYPASISEPTTCCENSSGPNARTLGRIRKSRGPSESGGCENSSSIRYASIVAVVGERIESPTIVATSTVTTRDAPAARATATGSLAESPPSTSS
jgi:hypothetical protein